MKLISRRGLLLTGLLLLGLTVFAQFRRGGSRSSSTDIRTAREGTPDGPPTPMWTNASAFKKDVFTFCRIRYSSWGGRGYGGARWAIDFPNPELFN